MIRTPDQRLRVFVSSTLQEMAPERAAAKDAITRLRLVPVMFELGARPHPPSELYRAYLEQSHIFVGLYWERYGWVAPDMEISGLEDEWILAANHPKLVYIKESADGREPRLVEMLDRIREDGSTSYRSFSTSDELRELLQDDLAVMLSERFESLEEAAASPAPVRAEPVHDVPRPPTPIIGRDLELATLADLLSRDDTRLVTICGSGGSGKTRLAVELATRARDELGWRVAYADLTGLRSTSLVMPTIAGALGIQDAGDRTLVEAIASVIDGTRVLLVIDNFEHVIDTAPQIAEVLAATTCLKVVVTSRQALRLRWEHEFPLHPLPVPDRRQQSSPDAVGASPAVELLVERVQRVRPGFRLDDANFEAVADIARRLDGLPLALELAAARMRLLGPQELLARLERRLDALGGPTADLPDRHRTLRATIQWSHDHLSAEEQRVFRRMGVFAGGATYEAVEAVCTGDDVDSHLLLDVVESLLDKSLLTTTTDGPTRVGLLETIREFAVEQLVEAGEAEETWDRHLRWFTRVAESAWDGFWTNHMADVLGDVERELDNLRGALDHAAGAGDPLLGLRLGAALWPFWDVRGLYREGERRLRELLELAPDGPSVQRGRGLSAQGWMVALLGDFERAKELMELGLPMVRAHGSPRQLAWSLAEEGNVAFSLGDGELCGALFDESLEISRGLDDAFLVGLGLFGQAYTAFLAGDLDRMAGKLDESLELTRLVIQPWGIAWAQFSRGILAIMLGDTVAAVPRVTESLELRWQMRDARGLTESIQILATLASANGDPEWSALLHGAAELQREANGLTILPFLRPMHDDSVARLHEALGEERTREIWQLGRSMPLEKLVPEALARAQSDELSATATERSGVETVG